MQNSKILVVILNWNGISDTINCLNSILKQQYSNYDVLVVDNGSNDNSAEILRQEAKQNSKIQLIFNEKNLGFAGGVNTGIRYALDKKYDYVALINNDAIAEEAWLAELTDALIRNKDAGICTGVLLHADGKSYDSTGDVYCVWGLPFPRLRDEKVAGAHPTSEYVFGASGGASLYSCEMLRDIGLFDEKFFAYYEDVDISFRAQLAGYKVYYTDKAVAYHIQGATSSKMPGFNVYQNAKNLPQLFWKNVPARLLLKIGLRFWFRYTIMFFSAVLSRNCFKALRGYFEGLIIFVGHSLGERARIQKNRRVSAEYIDSIIYQDIAPGDSRMRSIRRIFTGKA